jgi:hypothetical protein
MKTYSVLVIGSILAVALFTMNANAQANSPAAQEHVDAAKAAMTPSNDPFSIHARHDKTIEKIAALQARKPGEPNPFVSKDNLNRYVTLISECVQAQQIWRASTGAN